jgi:2-phospho-L-lactate guanylyltransferase
MISAVVPVKALASSKTRLAPGNRAVGVITPDPKVATAARDLGAEAVLRDDPGLNPAIEAGARFLTTSPSDAVLVVLGDVAAATSEDLAALLASAKSPGIALAPSSDGGTSALLRSPRDVIPACFGPDSAKRHREAAEHAGVACVERALPSLAIDLDVTADAEALLEVASLGPRTREALTSLLATEAS